MIRGITRKLDQLGRIVIPKEMRKELKLDIGTEIDIIVCENQIVLKKASKIMCKNCGNDDNSDEAIFCNKCGKRLEI